MVGNQWLAKLSFVALVFAGCDEGSPMAGSAAQTGNQASSSSGAMDGSGGNGGAIATAGYGGSANSPAGTTGTGGSGMAGSGGSLTCVPLGNPCDPNIPSLSQCCDGTCVAPGAVVCCHELGERCTSNADCCGMGA